MMTKQGLYSLFVQLLYLLPLINRVYLYETCLWYELLAKLTLNSLFSHYQLF